jgi:hypothetical protein
MDPKDQVGDGANPNTALALLFQGIKDIIQAILV